MKAVSISPGQARMDVFNCYAYTTNNPVKYIDPSGHASDLPIIDEVCPFDNCAIQALPPQWAIADYCDLTHTCTGSNIGWLDVDFGFTENLLGYNPGIVSLPYHIEPVGADQAFPWESVAQVTYNEHRTLHPYNSILGSAEYYHFMNYWIGDAIGIIQSMINRARQNLFYPELGIFRYDDIFGNNVRCYTPNQCALGDYASPIWWNTNDVVYGEFYGLAFAVIVLNVRVDQSYPYFAHQDLLDIRGGPDPNDRNSEYQTDSTGFGPTSGWKDHYVSPISAIDTRYK